MDFPADLKYSEHDEWIRLEGDLAVLGITDYAQDALGELVHVELLVGPGQQVEAGEVVAEVESVKAVAEVYTPVSGEVVAIHDALDGDEELVNSDPYGEGWLLKIRPSDASGVDDLMDAADYELKIAEA